MAKKRDYVRHEFVVNKVKHPEVATFIEHPANAGNVSNIIVALLEFHIWAGTVLSIADFKNVMDGLKSAADRIEKSVSRSGTATKQRESNKSALDNL